MAGAIDILVCSPFVPDRRSRLCGAGARAGRGPCRRSEFGAAVAPAESAGFKARREAADAKRMSAISSVGRAPPPPSYDAAMLRKVKQQTELEGEATLALPDSAKPTPRADGTASMIDDVA